MMKKQQQINLFSLLDSYETPEIPPEEQKKGMKGWIIECSGIFLVKNGCSHNYRGVCTRPIVFEQDTRRDLKAYSGWFQSAVTTTGPYSGWYGPLKRIFRKRPTWGDCLKYMKDIREEEDPKEVEYYEIIGSWNGVKTEY